MSQYWNGLVNWPERWAIHLVYGTFCTALLSGVIWQRLQIEQYRELMREAADLIVVAIYRGCFD